LNSFSKIAITNKNYTFLLLTTALLGVHFLSFDFGVIKLSPYRILLSLAPFIFLNVKKRTITQLLQSKNYGYFAFILFWVVYSIIPVIWVNDYSSWAKIYVFLLSGFITTWFIGLYFTSKDDIIGALKIVEFLSLFFGMIAFYEIFTGNYLFLNERSLDYYQERSQLFSNIGYRVPITVFANPNNYSLFLLFSVFSSWGLSKAKRTKLGRFLSIILTFTFIFLLLATQSRAGFIGLFLGLMSHVFILIRRTSAKNFWKIIWGIALTLIFGFPWFNENRDLFYTLLTIDFEATSGSDATRINLIKNGLHFLINTVFLGVGLGNIEYHIAHDANYQTGGITNIHNWWMEILVSSGIFVFLFYMLVFLKSLKRLFNFSIYKFESDVQHLSGLFFCFLIAFFVASVGSSSLMNNEWIWPTMAVVMSFINLSAQKSNR
jgi:teichuronic acid biosynthesis protein TuaE